MGADRVLVTRPAGQGEALCAGLAAAGFDTAHQPLLAIEALAVLPPSQRQLVLDLDAYQQVIFVSTNAVKYGMALVEDYWPQLPVGLDWYAIGERTAAHLAEHGVRAQTYGQAMTTESLLAHPDLQQVAGQRLLIVKGLAGRDTLRKALCERGARVDELCCYRRSPVDIAPAALAGLIREQQIGCILISSGEGLAHLLALLSPQETSNVNAMALIVPSARVAQQAREAGFSQVFQAASAADEAMVAAVTRWAVNKGEQQ